MEAYWANISCRFIYSSRPIIFIRSEDGSQIARVTPNVIGSNTKMSESSQKDESLISVSFFFVRACSQLVRKAKSEKKRALQSNEMMSALYDSLLVFFSHFAFLFIITRSAIVSIYSQLFSLDGVKEKRMRKEKSNKRMP